MLRFLLALHCVLLLLFAPFSFFQAFLRLRPNPVSFSRSSICHFIIAGLCMMDSDSTDHTVDRGKGVDRY
uniref:Putative secreted protein n=1 Tax=Anopheles darlingi TaxID=43151 RepID=A0A2M4DIR6_ANODA